MDIEDMSFRKMAGTAAVFIFEDYDKASPVERNGLLWSAKELHLEELPAERTVKDTMASVLALEGLESYDPATGGDVRHVSNLKVEFVYHPRIQGWVQIPPTAA